MADIWSIISSNYTAVGASNNYSTTPYVAVDPTVFQGTWTGTYANNQQFSVTVANISGFRATAEYKSGSTIKYQSVLIKDNAFRVGDSKFTVTGAGVAQIKTVVTDPVTGGTSVESANASQG
jgi:hypothetical protein